MSLRRHAASAASLLTLLVAAPLSAQSRTQPPAQRGGAPKQDTPYILVTVLQSNDRLLGVTTADEIRSRFQSEHSAQELYVVTKQAINATLDASGYKADSALNASDLMELAKQLRGDYVIEGKVNKSGTGNAVRLETRLLTRSGQQTLSQPLPAIDGKDVGDAAKQIERAVSEALKGMPGYKTCRNDYMAQKFDAAIKEAQAALVAYPNSTLGRACLLMVYSQLKPPPAPDTIIAAAEGLLKFDPMSLLALGNAADAYMAKGDTNKGVEFTMRMWKADPTNQTIAKSIIDVLAKSGSPEVAVPIIDTLLVQSPGDPEMLSTKWKILLKAANAGNPKLWKPAIAAGEELVKVDTAAATLDYFQRQIGAAQNDNDAAKSQEFAAKAAQKYPKDISLQLLLAQMYHKAGQSQQSLAAARRAMDIDPKSTTAALFAMTAANDMNQPDTAMAIAQKAIAGGASKDSLGQVLLQNAVPAIKEAQDKKDRASWENALKASQAVDAVAPSTQSKFFIGLSAFSISADALTNVQKVQTNPKAKKEEKAQACDEVKVAEDNFATAQMAIPAGAKFDMNAAGQLMQGIQTYLPYIPQFKKALGCK